MKPSIGRIMLTGWKLDGEILPGIVLRVLTNSDAPDRPFVDLHVFGVVGESPIREGLKAIDLASEGCYAWFPARME